MFDLKDVCIETDRDWLDNKLGLTALGGNRSVQIIMSRKTLESIQRLGKGYYCSLMENLVLYIAGQQNSCQNHVSVFERYRRAECGCPCSTITPERVS